MANAYIQNDTTNQQLRLYLPNGTFKVLNDMATNADITTALLTTKTTDNLTAGTLPVTRGGTGASTLSAGLVTTPGGTGALSSIGGTGFPKLANGVPSVVSAIAQADVAGLAAALSGKCDAITRSGEHILYESAVESFVCQRSNAASGLAIITEFCIPREDIYSCSMVFFALVNNSIRTFLPFTPITSYLGAPIFSITTNGFDITLPRNGAWSSLYYRILIFPDRW